MEHLCHLARLQAKTAVITKLVDGEAILFFTSRQFHLYYVNRNLTLVGILLSFQIYEDQRLASLV